MGAVMSEEEFTGIVQSTKKIVLGAVGRFLVADFYHAIDDVVQETYLRAFRSLEKNGFKGQSLVSTWLYTIAKRESLRMNSKLLREREKEKRAGFQRHETVDSAEEKFFSNLAEVKSLIEGLPVKYREIFNLMVKGFSENEIAQRLSISKGTVKSRKSRGREILLKMLHRSYSGGQNEY
jgi:RNA polymerase sigma-70 factor (ECF subfamily)